MKKFVAVVIAFLFLAPLQGRAEKSLGPEEFTSVDEIAFAIGSYFPKVQGEVKSVQGDKLTLGLGKKDGLLPGMVLTLWRDGRELLHPVTKALLGRAEEEIGAVEVVSVSEATAAVALKRSVKDPMAGDRARISPRRLNLGIIPLRSDRPEILLGLNDRLKELGRFTVLDTQKTEAFLKSRKERDQPLVREMIAAHDLDAVAAVGVYPVEEKFLVVVRIFLPEDTEAVNTVVALLTLAAKREALGDVRPFFAPEKTTADKLPDLPVDARYFDIADLDGDGVAEYVFSDETKLHVLRPDPAGWKELWTETVPSNEQGGKQFHLEAADINGNGRPEIYVSRMVSGRVSTIVVEYQAAGFRRIAEVPGFLSVLQQPGRGRILIGQEYDPDAFYSGPVREHAWSGGTPVAGQAISLPPGVNIYDFAFADFGEAHPLLVSFDRDNKVTVYSGDTVLWRSEERYASVDTAVIKPLTGLDAVVGRSPDEAEKAMGSAAAQREKDREVHIPGKILTVDLDGDRKDEVIIPRNTPVALVGGYKGGEVHSLAWTGNRLESRWKVKDLGGPVLGAVLPPQGKDSAKVAALVQVPGGLFGRDAYRVETYGAK